MKSARQLLLTLSMLTCGAVSPAWGDGSQQPYELVRLLQTLQDQVARGNATAHVSQRGLLRQISERLEDAPDEVWRDARNVRAAITFALSGGNHLALKKLSAANVLTEQDSRLAKAALAYVSGRSKEAANLLASIDAAALAPGLAGHLSLVHGVVLAKKEPQRALALLDQARLLSPGTLTEEAALRQQAIIHADAPNYDKFEATCTVYFRRFPRSIFGASLKQRFAVEVAAHMRAERAPGLDVMLAALDGADRRDLYLLVARHGVATGNVALTRIASARAASLSEENSVEKTRSRLYEAAVLVATDEFEKGRAALGELSQSRLPPEDGELAIVAAALADQVRGPLDPAAAKAQRLAGASDASIQPRIAGSVQQAISKVDRLLAGERQ